MQTLDITARTRVGRLPERQRTDRAALDALLDGALVATVSTVRDGEPFVLPMAVARDSPRCPASARDDGSSWPGTSRRSSTARRSSAASCWRRSVPEPRTSVSGRSRSSPSGLLRSPRTGLLGTPLEAAG